MCLLKSYQRCTVMNLNKTHTIILFKNIFFKTQHEEYDLLVFKRTPPTIWVPNVHAFFTTNELATRFNRHLCDLINKRTQHLILKP